MNIEFPSVEARARVHAALADATRLGIVDALTLGDWSPSELQGRLGVPSSLLAHHLGVLEAEQLVRRVRSEGDRRRTYLQLIPDNLPSVGVRAPLAVARVVFVCTGNSARSPLAAALWEQSSRVPATSAGTHPAEVVDRGALSVAARRRLVLRGVRPRLLSDVVVDDTDLLVTVCDQAHEELGPDADLHWSVPDPVAVGGARAFDAAFDSLAARVSALSLLVQAA